jgi:hypothetical protein
LLFDVSLIKEMSLDGMPFDPSEWGWGSHYIWRLFAGVVVTAIVGFLAGSIAKSKGALTAVISNIPSVIAWTLSAYSIYFYNAQFEERTAFVIISMIAIPLTTYIAFIAGGLGEEFQKENFEENTVFGIKPYHWIWAIFPIYLYALGIIFVSVKFIAFQFASMSDLSYITSIALLLALLPILAWGYPLQLVHRVLTGEILSEKNGFTRSIANFGILTLGCVIATGLQFGIYWLLAMMAPSF